MNLIGCQSFIYFVFVLPSSSQKQLFWNLADSDRYQTTCTIQWRTNSQSINLLNNHHKTRFSSTKINNSWSYECLAGNQLPKGQSESVYRIRTVKSRGDMSYTFGLCWFKMCFILRRKTSLVINICIIGNILSMMF